jgi:hypothetical protein
VLAAEHLLRLAGVHLRGEIVEGAAEVVVYRLAGLRPLDEHVQVVELPLQRVAQLDVLLQPAATLQQFLSAGLILPEVRSGDAILYAGKFDGGAGGVKGSSAGRRRGAPDLRICGADRRSA